MENVNRCLKGIGLGYIFRKFLWKKRKKLKNFVAFLYFP